MKGNYRKCCFFLLLIVFLTSNAQTIEELETALKKTGKAGELAKMQSDIGRLYFAKGAFVKAQDYFFQSLRTAEKAGHKRMIASAYNNIAATYMETENYPVATEYAQKAITANKALNDVIGLADSYNSLATIYYMEEKDSLSLHYSHESLAQRLIAKDSSGLFAGYKNLGAILFEMKDTTSGISYIEQSLRFINKKDSAKWMAGYLTLGQAYFYSGNLRKGKIYLDSSGLYVPYSTSYDRLEDYYYTLYKYNQKTGNLQQALINFEFYSNYRDSVISTRKNEQLSELNIKYEAEKKQKIIEQQKFEIAQKNSWLWVAATGLLLLCVGSWLVYKNIQYRQQKKIEQEKNHQQELAARALFEGEQNERIRIARDLHDGVGQMLSLLKMNLSTMDTGSPVLQKTMALTDKTIEEVRNVSHNLIPEELNFGIYPALINLAEKVNASGDTKMNIDIPEQLQSLQFEKQNELSIYRIVQEVINNMIRHAGASLINLSVSSLTDQIIISVKDNGRGLHLEDIEQSKGIGWKNINARVHMLEGKISVQSEKLSGTQIEIILPANGTK
jgi:two-component system NarL family sensor kinase